MFGIFCESRDSEDKMLVYHSELFSASDTSFCGEIDLQALVETFSMRDVTLVVIGLSTECLQSRDIEENPLVSHLE